MNTGNTVLKNLFLSLALLVIAACGKAPSGDQPGGGAPGGADQAQASCQDRNLGAHFEDVARLYDEVKADHDRKNPGDSSQKALVLIGGKVAAKYPDLSVDSLASCCRSPDKQAYGICQAFSIDMNR